MTERALTLRGWANLRHVSAGAIARETGAHRNTVMSWLRGQCQPSFLHGAALARALGITTEALELAIRASLRSHDEAIRAAGKRPAARHQGAAISSPPRTAAATAPAALRSGVGR